MPIRNRHRVGRYLVQDDESGLVHYDDQVRKVWDGSIRHYRSYETRQPQEFVRARNDPAALRDIRPEPRVAAPQPVPDQVGLINGTRLPRGPAFHLFGVSCGIGELDVPATVTAELQAPVVITITLLAPATVQASAAVSVGTSASGDGPDFDVSGASVECWRKTEATYFNSLGIQVTATAFEGRHNSFYYNAATSAWEGDAYLVENRRTNYIRWSREYDNPIWDAQNVTLTKNASGSEGLANTAWTVSANNSAAIGFVGQTAAWTHVANLWLTTSYRIKKQVAANIPQFELKTFNTVARHLLVHADPGTGSVQLASANATTTANARNFGVINEGDWWRVFLSVKLPSAALGGSGSYSAMSRIYPAFTTQLGSAAVTGQSGGLVLDYSQMEEESPEFGTGGDQNFPTSVIPTTSVSKARDDDRCYINPEDFNYNPFRGTWYVEFFPPSPPYAAVSDFTDAYVLAWDNVPIFDFSGGRAFVRTVPQSGAADPVEIIAPLPGAVNKYAFSYDASADTIAHARNGSVGTFQVPEVFLRVGQSAGLIGMGFQPSSGQPASSKAAHFDQAFIREIQWFSTAMTTAQVVALTSG